MSGIVGLATGMCAAQRGELLQRLTDLMREHEGVPKAVEEGPLVGVGTVGYVGSAKVQHVEKGSGSISLWLYGAVFGFEGIAEDVRLRANPRGAPGLCLGRYQDRGVNCAGELNGSFAIVIADCGTRAVHLIVDRAASRPLYYCADRGAFAFGTSVRALLPALPREGRSYDLQAVAELFLLEAVWGCRTLCRGIRAVGAGTIATWQHERLMLRRYHCMAFEPKRRGTVHDGARELSHVLGAAVGRRIGAVGRVGLLLSGGLDSRAVLAAADGRVTALTIGEEQAPEVRTARRVAMAAGVGHVLLSRGLNYYAEIVERAAMSADCLQRYTDAHAAGLGDQIAAVGVDALMSGIFFDVLLKGFYLPRWGPRTLCAKDVRFRAMAALSPLWTAHPPSYVIPFLAPDLREAADAVVDGWGREFVADNGCGPLSLQRQWLERRMLSNMQAISAGNFRLASLRLFEECSPCCDNDLLRFACTMPLAWKRRGACLRWALLLLSPRLAHLPEASTGLPACLMPPLDTALRGCARRIRVVVGRLRGKRARRERIFTEHSWHDLNALIRQSPFMQRLIRHAILQLGERFLDVGYARARLEDHLAGVGDHRYAFEIILTLAVWDQQHAALGG